MKKASENCFKKHENAMEKSIKQLVSAWFGLVFNGFQYVFICFLRLSNWSTAWQLWHQEPSDSAGAVGVMAAGWLWSQALGLLSRQGG